MKQTLYDLDFNLWIEDQIDKLENNRLSELDIEPLIEELKDLGKSEKNALESNLMILLAHLLNLSTAQADAPETMKKSWYSSVDEHRKRIKKQLSKTPSLKSYLPNILEEAYRDGRELAIKEGKRASSGIRVPDESEYPQACPFDNEQIIDEEFYSFPGNN